MTASATAPTQTTSASSATMRNRRKAAADRTLACTFCNGIAEHIADCPAFDPQVSESVNPIAAPVAAETATSATVSVSDDTLAALGSAFGVPIISVEVNGEPARVVIDGTPAADQSETPLALHVPSGEEYWALIVEAEDRVRECEEAIIPFKSELDVAKKRLALLVAAGKQAARERNQMKLGEAS